MIKLKSLIKKESDEEDEPINKDRLFNSDYYLEDAAEKLGWKHNFNDDFWRFPHTLYHCTSPENVPLIQQDGIKAKNETRGLTNRGTNAAIFTTMEWEEVSSLQSSYGSAVFEINTKLMKADGFMPEVSKEPEWERAHKLSFVFQKLGEPENRTYPERFVDSSDGVSDYTVIIHGSVPAKYVSLKEA
jgi:hypothetical protein